VPVVRRQSAELHPRAADGGVEEPKFVDAVIFRQNTEDLYAGVEWTDPPAQVREALALHPKFKRFAATPGPDLAISTRIFTRHACQRIVRAAFRYAAEHGYRRSRCARSRTSCGRRRA
jgi:isocitrate dehydrogenase (NAD+)